MRRATISKKASGRGLLTWPLVALFFCVGCGPLYYLQESLEHKEMRQQGYEACHIDSCGPRALEKVFQNLDINKTYTQIGKEIQDNDHIHYRGILSVLNHDFTKITCPPELLKYCRAQGLSVKKIKYQDLSLDKVAVLLIKGASDIRDWHWASWPQDPKKPIQDNKLAVENFFGDHTKVVSVYHVRPL